MSMGIDVFFAEFIFVLSFATGDGESALRPPVRCAHPELHSGSPVGISKVDLSIYVESVILYFSLQTTGF